MDDKTAESGNGKIPPLSDIINLNSTPKQVSDAMAQLPDILRKYPNIKDNPHVEYTFNYYASVLNYKAAELNKKATDRLAWFTLALVLATIGLMIATLAPWVMPWFKGS